MKKKTPINNRELLVIENLRIMAKIINNGKNCHKSKKCKNSTNCPKIADCRKWRKFFTYKQFWADQKLFEMAKTVFDRQKASKFKGVYDVGCDKLGQRWFNWLKKELFGDFPENRYNEEIKLYKNEKSDKKTE